MDSDAMHFPAPLVERGTLTIEHGFQDKSLKVNLLKLFPGTKIKILPLKDNIFYYQENGMDCMYTVNDKRLTDDDGTCYCPAGNILFLENTTDKVICVLAIQYPA